MLDLIAEAGLGDARRAFTLLERSLVLAGSKGLDALDEATVQEAAQRKLVLYDKQADAHYDVISAFIKSLRGSDPDAALYYLAVMLTGGEDPKFIARRMIIFASEDIGNADPRALEVAIAVSRAVEFVGLPECRINLAHGVTYLSCAPKSNASYMGIEAALARGRAAWGPGSSGLPAQHRLLRGQEPGSRGGIRVSARRRGLQRSTLPAGELLPAGSSTSRRTTGSRPESRNSSVACVLYERATQTVTRTRLRSRFSRPPPIGRMVPKSEHRRAKRREAVADKVRIDAVERGRLRSVGAEEGAHNGRVL